MKTYRAFLIVGLGALSSTLQAEAPRTRTIQILSPVYTIDRIYKSMQGPAHSQPIKLLENEPSQLVWITGFRTEIVGADGTSKMPEEFMCHINLDAHIQEHGRIFGWTKNSTPRLFTLSQAQFSVTFPKGFGMPVMSDEAFDLATQVLNHNFTTGKFEVRHKVTVDFIRDQDLKEPLKPLFAANAFAMKLLEGEGGHFGMNDGDESKHGPSCLPGEGAPVVGASSVFPDGFGKKFSGHWVVKPGKELSYTNVTKIMRIPFDTTLHYINTHLHPFAESLELRDLTTGKKVFKTRARGPKQGIGLTYMDTFTSQKGIPIYKDHEYQLISRYNNTTSVDQDAMATMFLYLLDKEFKAPSKISQPATVPQPVTVISGPRPRVRFRTTAGDLTAELYNDVAPKTVAQILTLLQAGVYDRTPFFRIEPGFVVQITNIHNRSVPLSMEQKALVRKIPGEFSPIKHQRGILSMARETADVNSGETSFSILLADAPHLDDKYTVFGKLTEGWDVLKALESAPRTANNTPITPIELIKGEILPSSPIGATPPRPAPGPKL